MGLCSSTSRGWPLAGSGVSSLPPAPPGAPASPRRDVAPVPEGAPLNDMNNFIHILKASADCICESVDGLASAAAAAAAAARASGEATAAAAGSAAASAVEAAVAQARQDVQHFLIAVTAHELVIQSSTMGTRVRNGDVVLAHPAAADLPAAAACPAPRVPLTQPGWVDVRALLSDLVAEVSRVADPVGLRVYLPPGPRLYARFHEAPVRLFLRLQLTRAVRVAQGVLEAASDKGQPLPSPLPTVGLTVGLAAELPPFRCPVPLPPEAVASAALAWEAALARRQPPGTVWMRFEVLDPFTGTTEASATAASIRHRYAFTVPFLLSMVEAMGGTWGGTSVPGSPGDAAHGLAASGAPAVVPPVALRWLLIPVALQGPEGEEPASAASSGADARLPPPLPSVTSSATVLPAGVDSLALSSDADAEAGAAGSSSGVGVSRDPREAWLWRRDSAPTGRLLGTWDAVAARFLTAQPPPPPAMLLQQPVGASERSAVATAAAAAPAPAAAAAAAASSEAPPPPLRLHVLLVDDVNVVRRFGAACLASLGCTSVTLTDGDEVPAELECAPRPFDAMLLDIAMTRTDGAVVCADLRRRLGARCPIIAMTSSATPADAARYRDMGFDVLLQKPFTAEAMRRALLLGLEARGMTRLARLPALLADGGAGEGAGAVAVSQPSFAPAAPPALAQLEDGGGSDSEADTLVILPSSPTGASGSTF